MPLVFQYGSNCDADRLNDLQRLNGHAEDRGRACTAEDFVIAFDVWSERNGCAASDLIPTPGQKAWGVLYEIPDDFIHGRRTGGQKTMAQIEGQRYEERPIHVRNEAGADVEATTFVVRQEARRQGLWTSGDYVGHIVNGLRAHDVSEDYVQHVIDVAVATNNRAGASAAAQTRRIEGLRHGRF